VSLLYEIIRVKSFTTIANGILRELKSDIGISLPYHPTKGGDPPEVKNFTGLWDTGATSSVITAQVASQCGLSPISMTRVYHANGFADVNVYLVNIILPNNVIICNVQVSEGILTGTDVLIGMDVIASGDFAVSNKDGKTMFSFRFPSIEHLDFVNQKQSGEQTPARVGRNDPCPCGSGKKFKKCCGTNG
jgi:predicted aspartyl protease